MRRLANNEEIQLFILAYWQDRKTCQNRNVIFDDCRMPTITAQGKSIHCKSGENLRLVLLRNGIDLYNGNAAMINCRAIGTCGTCAVAIEGDVSPIEWREKARLSLPPHRSENDRRLACQVRVLGDVRVTKYAGFWGQDAQIQWTPEQ